MKTKHHFIFFDILCEGGERNIHDFFGEFEIFLQKVFFEQL